MKQSTLARWATEMAQLDHFVETMVSDERHWTEQDGDPTLTIDYHADVIVVEFVVDSAAVSCRNGHGDFATYPAVSDLPSAAFFIGRAAQFLDAQLQKRLG